MAIIKAAMRGVWGAQTIEQTVSGYYIEHDHAD
jgi:hypothetical protein